jgi:hypothetical protein
MVVSRAGVENGAGAAATEAPVDAAGTALLAPGFAGEAIEIAVLKS